MVNRIRQIGIHDFTILFLDWPRYKKNWRTNAVRITRKTVYRNRPRYLTLIGELRARNVSDSVVG